MKTFLRWLSKKFDPATERGIVPALIVSQAYGMLELYGYSKTFSTVLFAAKETIKQWQTQKSAITATKK